MYGDDVAPLFLDPGTDLEVRFKGNDMSTTLRFKANDVPTGFATKLRNGTNLTEQQRHRQQAANANNYLSEFDAQFVENDGFQVLPDNIQLYEAPFLSFLEYRRKHELEFLEDHAAKQSFTQEFYNYAHAEVVYSYANDKLTFQDLREQVVNTEGRLKMAADYYNFLREPGLLNEPNAAQSELYHEFLLNYVHFAVAQDKHQRADPDFYPACYALAVKKLGGPTRAIILGRILQESFRFGHVKQSAAMLADFRNYDGRNTYYPTLQATISTGTRTLPSAPRRPTSSWPRPPATRCTCTTSPGKLVYLNFWKSTNGLCLRDLAYAQELMRKFEGKNIVFVNVALDENEQAWKSLVNIKKLPGVQVRVPGGGLRSAMAHAYALQEVPSYFPGGRRRYLPQHQAQAPEQPRRRGRNQPVVRQGQHLHQRHRIRAGHQEISGRRRNRSSANFVVRVPAPAFLYRIANSARGRELQSSRYCFFRLSSSHAAALRRYPQPARQSSRPCGCGTRWKWWVPTS